LTVPKAMWSRRRGPLHKRWHLTQYPDRFILENNGRTDEFVGDDARRLEVSCFWFAKTLKATVDDSNRRFRGLRREQSRSLRKALGNHLTRVEIAADLAAAVAWHEEVGASIRTGDELGRWIPEEVVQSLEASKPKTDLLARIQGWDGEHLAGVLTRDERAAFDYLAFDVRAVIGETNESIMQSELTLEKGFFGKVERTPLTEEQARAVVCFDNRVQVVAAAGSGKTSVMVARAAYAIQKGFVPPERCLLLAFNKKAAEELQERVDSRLDALGLPKGGPKAATFHSFGLSVIGKATGRKPRLAPWLDSGGDVRMICRIVDELRDRSPTFQYKWDFYRLLFARASKDLDGAEPDGWDKSERRAGFRTFRDEVVKSEGERIIANFLFLNGVDYRYEHPYEHDTAGPDHSQYRPDFYYPQIETWHEHWALDRDGRPPAGFAGYTASMEWKKNLHRSYRTRLIETTWAEIVGGNGLRRLEDDLHDLGVKLDWNPDRRIRGAKPLQHEELARLMRTFMMHVKSNSLTPELLKQRIADGPPSFKTMRNHWFLGLYWEIHEQWQAKLEEDDSIDFEDMLVRAAEHLEAGAVPSPYELILVDEFQDASQARARLVRSLASERGKYLLAVGDDWQSINRFAGADVAVMADFESWFGRAQKLRLTTTFRCPQTICDVSSAFISKNPRQLRKAVHAAGARWGEPVKILYADNSGGVTAAIEEYLLRLAAAVQDGEVEVGQDGPVSVDVLGRYNFDRNLMPRRTPRELKVSFRTVHSSKGLEADYIVLPNVTNDQYGFPSRIADDPVLDIVMPNADDFPHAEERRLFYVALTRARREVVLIASRGQESPFVAELVQIGANGLVTFADDDLEGPPRVCARCGKGLLVERTGPYGQFLACGRFPACTHREGDAWSQRDNWGMYHRASPERGNPF
jgi:DNA helicase IV